MTDYTYEVRVDAPAKRRVRITLRSGDSQASLGLFVVSWEGKPHLHLPHDSFASEELIAALAKAAPEAFALWRETFDDSAEQAAQADLYSRMCHMSEDYFFAEWHMGIEFVLYDALLCLEDRFDPYDVERLREAAKTARGWWWWHEQLGPIFLGTREWEAIYHSTKKGA